MDHQEGAGLSGTGKPIENRKRKRIPYNPSIQGIVDDPLALMPNKSTAKARRIFTTVENLTIELWFDKHYIDRCQYGDELGKREGIGYDAVESLVKRSLKHMIVYTTLVKGFNFLNRNIQPHDRPLRIVLQEQTDHGLLNVVIETHFLDIDRYEITVKTAMCKDDYQLTENEYAIELDSDGSILKKYEVKKIREVYTI